jgi:hypothetical protein
MADSLSLKGLEQTDPGAPSGGVERRFLCPLCGEGKPKDAAHRSLGVNMQSGAWVCHRCGEKGKLSEWKSHKPLSGRVLQQQELKRAFSIDHQVSARADIHRAAHDPSPDPSLAWHNALQNLLPLTDTLGEKYLLSRGINRETSHIAGVRFSPSWFGRPAVIFPIRNAERILVAAQGRYLRESKGPKARTVGNKKAGVFVTAGFWDDVRRGAPLVICEAPIDALSIAICGFPALALCGKDGWPDWLPIKCAFKSVALAFDADDAGDEGAEKLDKVLSSLGAKPFRLRPENGKDWNEILMNSSATVLREWLVEHLL